MIRKLFTIEHAVHLVMICFALSSLGNVSAFLTGAGHPWYSAWLLAVALAVGLTALSIMLTGIDRQHDPLTFWTITAAATALGLLSGSLQSAEYARHLNGWWSIFLGFTSPIGGEIFLAFAASLHGRARKRARFASIGSELEDGVATVMVDAMANVDRAGIQRRVDKVLNQMAGLAIDSAAQKAMCLYIKEPTQLNAPTTTDLTPAPTNTPILNSDTPDFAQRMNDAKRKKSADRQNALFDILRNEFNGVSSDELNRTALGERLGTTRQTIGKDLEALIATNRISLNGHLEVL